MTQKNPEAFRTISEVGEELDVPQHVLRFWETKFSAVKPLKRGGGRRYYRPGDVDLIRGIKTLLYTEGYTIRGVQKVLRTRGARFVAHVGQTGALALPSAQEAIAAVPEGASQEAEGPVQLSLVEPAPVKLATVERRQLQRRLDALLKLRGEISKSLQHRTARVAVPISDEQVAGTSEAPVPPKAVGTEEAAGGKSGQGKRKRGQVAAESVA